MKKKIKIITLKMFKSITETLRNILLDKHKAFHNFYFVFFFFFLSFRTRSMGVTLVALNELFIMNKKKEKN